MVEFGGIFDCMLKSGGTDMPYFLEYTLGRLLFSCPKFFQAFYSEIKNQLHSCLEILLSSLEA